MKKAALIFTIVFLMVFLTACSGGDQTTTEPDLVEEQEITTIVVASKNFTEQFILAQMMGQLLQDKTNHDIIIREGGFQTSLILNQGMSDGDIHVFADYTGTGYINVLQNELSPDDTPELVYQKAKEGYEEEFGFTWLEPFGFDNTYALASSEVDVATLSDLAELTPNLIIGMDQAFYDRVDGYQGLSELYGFDFMDYKEMDVSLGFSALAEGEIDVMVCYSTDGRISAYNLNVIEDDKNYFPPYYAAPIVRIDFLEKYPEVGEVLNLLAGKLDEKTMSDLNAQVDMEGKEVSDVAYEFLKSAGLIE